MNDNTEKIVYLAMIRDQVVGIYDDEPSAKKVCDDYNVDARDGKIFGAIMEYRSYTVGKTYGQSCYLAELNYETGEVLYIWKECSLYLEEKSFMIRIGDMRRVYGEAGTEARAIELAQEKRKEPFVDEDACYVEK